MSTNRLIALALSLGAALAASADIVIENNALRLTLGEDGSVKGLLDRTAGKELLAKGHAVRAFEVTREGKAFLPTAVAKAGDGLRVEFKEAGTTAAITVKATPSFIAFKLAGLIGPRPDALRLLCVPVEPRENFGSWLNVVWDDQFAVALVAGNVATNCHSDAKPDRVLLTADCDARVRLEGCEAVLLGCPRLEFLGRLDRLERDYDLPHGVTNRNAPAQRWSYFWSTTNPATVDRVIQYAKQGGFRQLIISYTEFSTSAGHFPWRDTYPNGLRDLQAVVRKVRAAGLSPGMHIHFNKAHQSDPYVTPVPDRRLYKDRSIALAAAIDARATEIPTATAPTGFPTEDGQRELQIGDEIVEYRVLSTQPPFAFKGCTRGYRGTTAAPHPAGETAYRLGIDVGWPIFVRFDQETNLQQEVARRIASLYNPCGFDFVYFDGSEDVYDPFWYYIPKAQSEVYRLLQPEPTVAEGAARGHFSWHMLSRSNAYDSVPPEEIKDFCRTHPCPAAASNARDFTGVNFGWLAYSPRTAQTIGTQPDMLEFVASRAAAWDCPLSLHTSTQSLDAHPRTADNLEVIRNWENARIEGWLTDDQKRDLRDLKQEHILLVTAEGDRELHPYRQIEKPAGGSDRVRAFVFERDGKTVIVYWHPSGSGQLRIALPATKVKLYRPWGTPSQYQAQGDAIVLPLSDRHFLECADLGEGHVIRALEQATVLAPPP